jgi:hypothetical protein
MQALVHLILMRPRILGDPLIPTPLRPPAQIR